ncbi:MAG: hypothetical protein CMJ18_20925 [Phycisphaeraceae bacterium]|nr:hypothetical protein [Phycisphaeraceae bacterium]
MRVSSSTLCIRILLACIAALAPARAVASASDETLVLARDGTTNHSIVIAADAAPQIVKAAEELSYFLERMTRAKFAVRRDDTPKAEHEIVLGPTNRKALADVPEALQPSAWEGFVILPEDRSLYIMGGQIPRGTLYGVYDFLEQDLGVRFLAPEANHVPRRAVLHVPVRARVYDPPFEYRAHFPPNNQRRGYGEWTGRSRINSIAQGYGHVRRVGHTVHTFHYLVPPSPHFDENREMFALINGKRTPRELCLSHPETLRVATRKVLDWAEGAPDDPGIRSIIQVSQNDTGSTGCKCPRCAAADAEEGAQFTGQLIRFVNAIARVVGRDHPQIYVETLAYHRSEYPPQKAVAEPNVAIWFAPIGQDLGRPLDEQPKHWNNLQGWRRATGRIFVWDYTQGFHDLLAPFPSLWTVARNIQLYAENGAQGYMPQQPTSDGTEMRYLRNYMMAQLQWRPDQDYRRLAEEFCRLYYGLRAGAQIMQYVDLLHDSFQRANLPLNRHGSFKDDAFVVEADRILTRASEMAELPEQARRIAEFRLPIWRLMLIQAFGRHGKVMSLPQQWWHRQFEEGADDSEDFSATTDFGNWQEVRIPIIPAADYDKGGGLGPGWYGTSFNLADAGGAPLALHFESMQGTWDVWIDGRSVATAMPSGLGLYREKEVPYVRIGDGLSPGHHVIVVRVRGGSGFYKAEQYQNPRFTTADAATIVDMSQPLPPALRAAAEGFLPACSGAGLVRISYGYGPTPTTYLKDLLWPKVRFLLTHGNAQRR